MRRLILFVTILAAISISAAKAQSPMPIIVPAASSAPVRTTVGSAPPTQDSTTLQSALKILRELKAANEETLKKQEATLQQLDEIQKAAEQLKIFSKRG